MQSSHNRSRNHIKYLIGVASILVAFLLWAASSSRWHSQHATTGGSMPGQARIMESYGQLPLHFEANQGQAAAPVKFRAHGRGYQLSLTANEAVWQLQGGKRKEATPDALSATLRLTLAGAQPQPRVEGLEPLPGRVNYFIGADAAQWRANVPTYASVKYTAVYPGIDLVYYGNQQQLEYDFIVAPGADPQAIRLDFEGAEQIEIDAQGELALHLANGTLRQRKPVIYQEVNGARKEVAGSYVRTGEQQIGFQLGEYDRRLPLVIDPILSYSTYLGGGAADAGNSVVVDSAGNAYVTGNTASANFPTASPLQAATGGGTTDAFIAKLNAAGTALIYATYFGGNGADSGVSLAVDSAGQTYVCGSTSSTNLPTVNPFQPSYGGGASDNFVFKLNATGTALLYSTYLGGNGNDSPGFHSIAIDRAGQAYLAGNTTSTNFPVVNPVQSTYGGGASDGTIVKLNVAGNAAIYSSYLGGNGDDACVGVDVDASGNVYLTGRTASPNFPLVNPLQAVYGGGAFDAFVTKLNAAGTALVYSTYLGGSADDRTTGGVVVDTGGNVYVAGFTGSSNFPTVNGAQLVYGGGPSLGDGFVAKLNTAGSALIYSTYLGGSGDDICLAMAVDTAGSAYVTGRTTSTDYPITNAAQATYGGGANDVFVTKVAPAGATLAYSTFIGGSGDDRASGLAVDADGSAYVTGNTTSTNFPTRTPAQAVTGGGQDALLAKLSTDFSMASAFDNTVNLGAPVNTADSDQHPALSANGLSLYITTQRAGGAGGDDLWVARRANPQAAWGAPQNLGSVINTGSNDRVPTFSRDGRSMFFGSNRPGGQGGIDLYLSTRTDPQDDFGWTAPVNLGPGINTAADEDGATFFEDLATGANTLYFTSNRPGGPGDYDIYASRRNAEGLFAAPVLVNELSSTGRDTRTALRRDGLEIFLTTDRPGGLGLLDVWVARRASTLEPWSAPFNPGAPLNTTANDGAPALSADGATIYFYSTRPGGLGSNDLYVATRNERAALATVSAASYRGGALASESLAAAFGVGLSGATSAASALPLPSTLAGTSVRIRDSVGMERLAPLLFVSPRQINYQIPAGIAPGPATVTVVNQGASAATGTVLIAGIAPGVFTANGNGQGVPAALLLRIKPGNVQSFEPVATFDTAQNRFVPLALDLGPETDQVFLVLFGTGLRFRSSLTAVSVRIADVDGQVTFAGPQPDAAGLDQVNVRLPRSLIGRGEAEVTLLVDGQTANAVRVNIK